MHQSLIVKPIINLRAPVPETTNVVCDIIKGCGIALKTLSHIPGANGRTSLWRHLHGRTRTLQQLLGLLRAIGYQYLIPVAANAATILPAAAAETMPVRQLPTIALNDQGADMLRLILMTAHQHGVTDSSIVAKSYTPGRTSLWRWYQGDASNLSPLLTVLYHIGYVSIATSLALPLTLQQPKLESRQSLLSLKVN